MKVILTAFIVLMIALSAKSQRITGNWEGNLEVQGKLIPIVFHIVSDSSGKLSATFDSPSQKAFNLACNEVISNADSVVLVMNMIKGRYSGKLSDKNKQLIGNWFQGSSSLPLNMKKTSDVVSIREQKRPQTPKPPFPYKVEEVEYDNADRSIHFGATFTVPLPEPGVNYFKAPAYPTVLLITGSGKQDRDETIMGHKPFAVIADYLTRHGIAVLRVDDRDMGKTSGNFSSSTTADFANDVEAGINYLKTRNDVDAAAIGLMGHSEGGLIAPMVASRRTDIKFIVLLAGPGKKIIDLMEQQSIDVAVAAGASKKEMEQYGLLYHDIVEAVINAPDSLKATENAIAAFKLWQKDRSATVVKNTTGVDNEKSLHSFISIFVKQLRQTWFSYFIKINPAEYLSRVKCPVLALNGQKDIQVASGPNLTAIKNILEKSGNRHFKTMEIAAVNHLFQHCKKCSVDEYSELEETFAPEALDIITGWIRENIK